MHWFTYVHAIKSSRKLGGLKFGIGMFLTMYTRKFKKHLQSSSRFKPKSSKQIMMTILFNRKNKLPLIYIQLNQEEFWREKSRTKWFAEGHRNTKDLHCKATTRATTINISLLKHNDTLLVNKNDIEAHVVNHFHQFSFISNRCSDHYSIINVIPRLLTDVERCALVKQPTLLEVKQVVFNPSSETALGLDGFSGAFYKKFWYIQYDTLNYYK